MSAYPLVDRAVEAMKLGAYNHLIKPVHIEDMASTLQRAVEMLALRVRVCRWLATLCRTSIPN